ncbi:MAG: hypothetical protein AAB870_00335 [Patescibacteria group bacterium]
MDQTEAATQILTKLEAEGVYFNNVHCGYNSFAEVSEKSGNLISAYNTTSNSQHSPHVEQHNIENIGSWELFAWHAVGKTLLAFKSVVDVYLFPQECVDKIVEALQVKKPDYQLPYLLEVKPHAIHVSLK